MEQREEHWAIVDLVGKRRAHSNCTLPDKVVIDPWIIAAGLRRKVLSMSEKRWGDGTVRLARCKVIPKGTLVLIATDIWGQRTSHGRCQNRLLGRHSVVWQPSAQGTNKYYGLFHGVRVEGGPQNCLPERMILLCKYLCLLRLLDDLYWCAD